MATAVLRPETAMVLAAGLGQRMRPLTDTIPKPLVPLAGRPLVDHVLDRIAAAGIGRAVVNVHYRADLLVRHLEARTRPQIVISDERDALLDTGGGVRRALPLLGGRPFLVHNSDTVWIEATSNLSRLAAAWDDARMDALLLLADRATSLGYTGVGDFELGDDGRVVRRPAGATVPYVFAGASIASPRLLAGTEEGRFSLNVVWDRAMAAGRLYAVVLHGIWMHVGDPKALADAEALIAARGGLA